MLLPLQPQQGTRSESGLNFFWWFAKQRIPLLVCGVSSLLRGLHGARAAQTRANTPGKAARGQQLTVSLKQHSHSTKYEKLATNGGAIGAPWALWGGLGWTTGRLDPLPDSVARGQNMSDIHTRVTLHGNYSPQIPKPTVA